MALTNIVGDTFNLKSGNAGFYVSDILHGNYQGNLLVIDTNNPASRRDRLVERLQGRYQPQGILIEDIRKRGGEREVESDAPESPKPSVSRRWQDPSATTPRAMVSR